MSKYTTEVRFICEAAHGLDESAGYDDIETILNDVARDGIVIPTYPIFDEQYRIALNKKILMHYYTREIGMETVGLWKLRLKAKLNEIMPYYNKLYESELLQFNPFHDVDLTTDKTGNSGGLTKTKSNSEADRENERNGAAADVTSGERSNHTNTESASVSKGTNEMDKDNKRKYSDTPQGSISDLEAGNYLTNATIDNGSEKEKTSAASSGTTDYNENSSTKEKTNSVRNDSEKDHSEQSSDVTSAITNTEQYAEHIVGKRGSASYASLLKEFRTALLNIDMMVIEELADLFFMLY